MCNLIKIFSVMKYINPIEGATLNVLMNCYLAVSHGRIFFFYSSLFEDSCTEGSETTLGKRKAA